MKKFVVFLVLTTVVIGVFTSPSKVWANQIPVIEVHFEGTPQALLPEVRNSGIITLTLHLNGNQLSDLDKGRVVFKKYDGTEFKIRDLWECEEDICTLTQYIPIDTEYVYIDTTIPILWIGWGPWEVLYQNNGIHKKEMVTHITFSVTNPMYRYLEGYNPIWDWGVVGEPAWAANQWFKNNTVDINISTSCNGHGTNHNGIFAWENVPTLPCMFGNGVVRRWVKEPLSVVQWEISGTIGDWWTQNGETLGPVCWNSLTYLPLISK